MAKTLKVWIELGSVLFVKKEQNYRAHDYYMNILLTYLHVIKNMRSAISLLGVYESPH